MKKKIALIFGVTGQDGAYLARFLLSKNYIVHGVKRKSSSINTSRIDEIYKDPFIKKTNFYLHYGDIADSLNVYNLVRKIEPTEIYNLAAQSHVKVSFEMPEYTSNVTALGALRILDAIKNLNIKIKYYQAGSSEMFGKIQQKKQDERTKFYPRSPYAASKCFAHYITVNYREAYDIFACNGILFNHESPIRGETFVTKKITKALCEIKFNKREKLYLGNIYSKRDWGFAKDYVEAMWKMLQQEKPDDFVISTGKTYTVKFFINECCKQLDLKIKWRGKGLKEKAFLKDKPIIEIDKKYFRPSEVDVLLGNSKKAKKILNWRSNTNIHQLIKLMIKHELKLINS